MAGCALPHDAQGTPTPPSDTHRYVEAGQQVVELLSPTYLVDRQYRSMEGPYATQTVQLEEGRQPPELLWITSYQATVVGPDGTTPMSQEFMCHSDLIMDVRRHAVLFGGPERFMPRLFLLAQGQHAVAFPPGFGMPIMSDEPLQLTTQVLNLNQAGAPFQVRHKVTVRFVRDRALQQPLQPLMAIAAFNLVPVEGASASTNRDDQACCLIGQPAPHAVLLRDAAGRQCTGHWLVPPGRQVVHTNVTAMLAVPFDTTIHAMAVHLHPCATSLALRDLTTGTTLWTSHATNAPDHPGLVRVEAFSDAAGIPVYRQHAYELLTVYENPTPVNQDAMASIQLYLLDRAFQPPTKSAIGRRAAQAWLRRWAQRCRRWSCVMLSDLQMRQWVKSHLGLTGHR